MLRMQPLKKKRSKKNLNPKKILLRRKERPSLNSILRIQHPPTRWID